MGLELPQIFYPQNCHYDISLAVYLPNVSLFLLIQNTFSVIYSIPRVFAPKLTEIG